MNEIHLFGAYMAGECIVKQCLLTFQINIVVFLCFSIFSNYALLSDYIVSDCVNELEVTKQEVGTNNN